MNSGSKIWRPYQHIFFDCDSTLTQIEGIDELADLVGKGDEVRELTRLAMEGKIDLEEALKRRLELLRPTRGQIEELGELYVRRLVPDAREVVRALVFLGRRVYIVSGGFVLALRRLAAHLGIPQANVLGVDLWFDELQGEWFRYHKHQYRPNPEERYLALDHSKPTVRSTGKATAIRNLGSLDGGSMLVGDGASDLAAKDAVDLFVGYGGVARRATVEQNADLFLPHPSLAPALALAAGPRDATRLLHSEFAGVLRRGIELLVTSAVIRRPDLRGLPGELQAWFREHGVEEPEPQTNGTS
ncbi:MAG: HAD-IB family phosphatase [Calditrichaeota bacterium]|nr:HAD-IB family phosphatase [Calditrichota bacterium]